MTLNRIVTLACLVGLLLASGAIAAELKSGPQTGERVPGPFHPLNVTGENEGKKFCLYCQNGANPVAMIFARENSPALVTLIKQIDTATAKHKSCSMGSFVVYLSDSEKLAGELKAMAKKQDLKHCVLSIDNPAGPEGYKVDRDADVTVVLYTNGTVKANHSFKKGELKDKDVEKIVADVAKILPQK